MAKIPKVFIDELLDRLNIADVIQQRMPLKKAGTQFVGSCPFHSEKTGSFTVTPVKKFFHCFGCGAHGNAIEFVMRFDKINFVAAVDALAKYTGSENHVTRPENAERTSATDTRVIYSVLTAANKYFQDALRSHPTAAEYLKSRGVTGKIAKEYGLGFAPPGWSNIDVASKRELLAAGLIIEKESGGYFDRFRNRIIYPIRDKAGRVVGFGGRTIDPADDAPKYINTPTTAVFRKGHELYGVPEALARMAATKPTDKTILVVEGYMDVLSLAQHGIPNAVATLGTTASLKQIELMLSIAPKITFCFDGDKAGREAAFRTSEIAKSLPSRQVSFVFLPTGDDPDSLVRREGVEAFKRAITNPMPLDKLLASIGSHKITNGNDSESDIDR